MIEKYYNVCYYIDIKQSYLKQMKGRTDMNLLKDLKELAGEFAEVSILPCSDYRREANKKNTDIKDVFTIKIVHKDTKVGKGFQEHDMFTLADIMPSKYMSFFNQELKRLLANTKLYVVGCSECGNELMYNVMWNRNRGV